MGYTHYWRTPKVLEKSRFEQFSKDCKAIIDYCETELGINHGNGVGEGEPEINSERICFNGSEKQQPGVWTTNENISIPWPATKQKEPVADPIAEKVSGHWYAGHELSQRVAPLNEKTGYGSGSYETFCIDREQEECYEPDKNGLYFNCTKTAYRPYDLTVTACLIALKHHFPECKVSSDGELENWADGARLCVELFDYGHDFEL